MNKFLKALIISLIIFVTHLITFFARSYFKHSNFGYYGLWGEAALAFIFGFWAYYILSLTYLYVTKSKSSSVTKLIYAFVVVVIGYFVARISDIIDGDFISRFDFFLLLICLISSILLVALDKLFSGYRKLT